MTKSINGKRKARGQLILCNIYPSRIRTNPADLADESSLSTKTESVLRVEPLRPSKARRLSTIESILESEEDPGRTESQQLLATIKTAAKALTKPARNNKFLADFRKKIEADQQELVTILEDKENDAATAEKEFRDALRSHLSAALSSPSTNPQASVRGRERPRASANGLSNQHSPYYAAGMRLVEESHNLMKDFEHLSQLTETTMPKDEDSPAAGWQADRDKVTRLLELGRKVAEKKVARVVETQMREQDGEDAALVDGEEYGEASVYFGRKEMEETTLKDTLRRAERGVKTMVKGLPMDED